MSMGFSNTGRLTSCGTTPMHAFGTLQVAVDVVAEHAHAPAGLVHQRRDDADRGGLAGAVGAEQREEVTRLDRQVYALERLHAVG
jgi:hypothetical protein